MLGMICRQNSWPVIAKDRDLFFTMPPAIAVTEKIL
jgi:hypothetical protein